MVAGGGVPLVEQACTNERAEVFAVEGVTSFRFMQEAPESQAGEETVQVGLRLGAGASRAGEGTEKSGDCGSIRGRSMVDRIKASTLNARPPTL